MPPGSVRASDPRGSITKGGARNGRRTLPANNLPTRRATGCRSRAADNAALGTARHGGKPPRYPFLQHSPAPVRILHSSVALASFSLAAVGELIADQLPSAPNRLASGALTGRLVSGTLASAVVCLGARRSPRTTRMTLDSFTHLQDHVWGGVEDIIALGLGRLALGRRLQIPDRLER